ncbi:glycoside hydrolase family 16 protein [Laetiporus sulphureus 93-53]|uniref:Glycoside hydrolase family 16 protein n=1 Tax=Laetiporus sulphureus 93-53 TaxID=1314785 RepID=A0A165CQY7_9APHY|nr:glycoside hydrolase family 16 protein [Laetiporus sulphureus 93-53]KZT03265.1 glycoside hydrolase family 16 protein [Laetiporus sulphureus 93-53]
MRAALFAASVLSSTAFAANYSLVRTYQGSDFFDGWSYYNYYDNTTSGDVEYVNASYATSDKLAYVTDAGQTVIKVDNTTFVPYNYKRDSVRITTDDYFEMGSVILFDAAHLPFGCSVWPSFWTKGQDWPAGGEIDILEAVNQMTYNQYALHTNAGCNASSSATASGTIGTTDCNATAGCTYAEAKSDSYGSGFNSAGGGVWATLLDASGISIWFWSRADIPSSISTANTSIDISDWGTPSANYSSALCDIETYFAAQQLVLDITLCGDWAGDLSTYTETCSIEGGGAGNASSCYLQNVYNYGNTTALDDAYFLINYVKAFNVNSSLVTPSGSSSSISPTGTAALGTGGNSSGSSSGSASGSTGTNSSSGSSSGAFADRLGVQFAVLAGGIGALAALILI